MVSTWSIENCRKRWLLKLHTLQCKKLLKMTYNAESCLRWLSSKGCNSIKINSSSIKKPHAHFQYVNNKYARFQSDPLKTVRGVDYTNSIPYNAKCCLKWLSSICCNAVVLASSKTQMHIFNMSTTGMQGFKKIHWKLWEELISQTLYRKVWRTDGQTGANLNAPWLSSRGHKK